MDAWGPRGQAVLRRQGVIEDVVQEMNPFIGIGLGQAKELSVQRLGRRLFEIDQNKEQFIFSRGQRTVAVGGVGATHTL
jgi:hypothetical protein